MTLRSSQRESTNILSAIGAVNIFIEAGIEKGGVLVHCAGGRSRSAAFVVAFLMSTLRCGYDVAYAQVRRSRPVVSVNRGFEQQLRAYGAAQCDVFAAFQMMLRVRAATLLDRRNLLLLRRGSNSSMFEGEDGCSKAGGGGCSSGSSYGSAGGEGQTRLSPQHQTPPLSSLFSTAGIPSAPKSPRGRGRCPAGGNPATSYWQRRVSGGGGLGNGGGALNSGSALAVSVAAAATALTGKGREGPMHFLPKEVRFLILCIVPS